MDKNTVIGFVLIGLVLVAFSWLNRPSQEQLEARQRYQDSIASAMRETQQQQAVDAMGQTAKEASFIEASPEGIPDSLRQAFSDSLRRIQLQNNYGAFAQAVAGTDEVITLENNNVEVKISSKGGQVCYARVKDYVTYEKEPLVLFDDGDSRFSITFVTAANRVVNTSDLYFTPVKGASENSVVMRLTAGEDGIVDFVYTLNPDDYMLNFTIRTSGLDGLLATSTNALDIQWRQKMRTLEKGRKLENQYTGLYYKFLTDEVEHFGESKDEEKQLSNRLKWIGYKNKYFTSVLIVDEAFEATTLSVKQEVADTKYLKEFNATTAVTFNAAADESIVFRYFFGPNKYRLLRSYDRGIAAEQQLNLDNLVPMGYQWVRPINKYFILPIFDYLGRFMSNYGLIIFILTLAAKFVLFPLTYKSYMSQARMRVLRPQVEALKLKFPKKEQAMELQQATMALYSSAGASPMSGCLPMLLQMPILIALYWLFPTAIELRQQGFLWAEDLSTYDAVISWDAQIPFVSSFIGNHISLFCLLMTIVNLVYTKVNMSMSNTGQQQMPGMNMMMYIMPLMFFFMFNQNSSGLSYYFLVSTLITIGQTMLFRFAVNEEKLLAKLEENKKKPKKKSGFMKRLEEAQRVQQEQLRKQQKEREKRQHSSKR
ncbi:MAG: membrane protein insertase YidC [Tannerella sp.]|jgi:YidC/Oxa1 family membrane protein insertase|nr:membrane protein insertase YidC [Tannerella sp.]